MPAQQEVAVVGAGAMGRLVLDSLAGDERWRVVSVHDDGCAGDRLHGFTVTGTGPDDLRPGQPALMAIGDPGVRRAVAERLQSRGVLWQTFVDRRSLVCTGAQLGLGTLVLPFCMVGSDAVLDRFCIMSAYSRVGDGSRVGAFSSMMPGSTVGDSIVGEECLLGLNSVCLAGARLGDRVTVTPLSFVRGTVPAGAMATGNPARIFRRTTDRRSISAEPA